jgi:phage-related protein
VDVRWHPDARAELRALPPKERATLLHAEEKLVALGQILGYPHTSAVRGLKTGLRELRPRRGNSPWRALYWRIGDCFVIGAVAPEAQTNPRGFNAAVAAAEQRLAEIVED